MPRSISSASPNPKAIFIPMVMLTSPPSLSTESGEFGAQGVQVLVGQGLDLAGHHGEALAVLPGARRLNGGIERQQIGLLGDVVDGGDDLADGLGLLSQGQDILGSGLDLLLDLVQGTDRFFDD